jgi:hypothetical protein
MKKLLSIVAISALLTTGMNATNNQLTVTGSVAPAATIHLGTAPQALTSGTGLFQDSEITFDNNLLLNTSNTQDINLFLATNTTGAVTMTITPADLVHSTDTNAKLTVSYTYTPNSGSADNDDVYELGGATNAGTKVGVLTASVTPAAAQLAGTYSQTITVTVSAALASTPST